MLSDRLATINFNQNYNRVKLALGCGCALGRNVLKQCLNGTHFRKTFWKHRNYCLSLNSKMQSPR